MWRERRTIKDLDLALREAQARWIRVEQRAQERADQHRRVRGAHRGAAGSASTRCRCGSSTPRRSRTATSPSSPCASSKAQKDRLATYQVQARFALATDVRPRGERRPADKRSAPEPRSARGRAGEVRRRRSRRQCTAGRTPSPEGRLPRSRSYDSASLLIALAARSRCRAAAAADKPQTIKDLESKPVEVRKDAKVPASSSKAMENYRRFLELQKTDPQLRAEALRRLGDLNLEAGELERMENEVTAIDLQGGEAIKLYSTLLKAYPELSAQRPGALPARARVRDHRPAGAGARARSIASCAVSAARRRWTKCSSAAASCCSPRSAIRDAQSAYAVVDQRGASVVVLRAEPVQARLVAVQAVAERREPAVLRRRARSEAARRQGPARRPRRPRSLKRADRELVEDTLRVMGITFSVSRRRRVARRVRRPSSGNTPYSYLLYSRPRRPVRREAALPGRGDHLSRLRRARPEQRPRAEPRHAGHRGLSQGRLQQLVLDGKHEYVERYNFGSPFWQGRERAQYPQVVQELKTNLKDVATHFHATAQKSKSTEDFQEAAQVVSRLPASPSRTIRIPPRPTTCSPRRCSRASSSPMPRPSTSAPRTSIRRTTKSATAGYAALVAYQKEEERLDGTAKAEWHAKATDAGVKFAQTFPEHPDSAGRADARRGRHLRGEGSAARDRGRRR